MNRDEMKRRTKGFELRIVRLSKALPGTHETDVIGRQLLKSGTSIGANYREATRSSSRRHFVTNLAICLREGDETIYWLELLAESEIMWAERLTNMLDECNQLVAILTAAVRTTKKNSPPNQTARTVANQMASDPNLPLLN